ncbi:MAG: lysophospholipid acyltransferase family protein [Wenzhouxiangellaceae bacterium]
MNDSHAAPELQAPAPVQWWRYLYRVPLFALLLFAGFVPLAILLLPGLRDVHWRGHCVRERYQCSLARWLLRALGMRLVVSGRLPQRPFLLAANHISWYDILALHALVPVWLVAKAEIHGWPLIGVLARAVGTIFIVRGDDRSSRRVSRRMRALLRTGEAVGFFPEAGIARTPGVRRFHARLFGPAIRCGVPVVPVAIRYWRDGDLFFERAYTEGRSLLGLLFQSLGQPPCEVQLMIGPALDPDGRSRDELARLAEQSVRSMLAGGC